MTIVLIIIVVWVFLNIAFTLWRAHVGYRQKPRRRPRPRTGHGTRTAWRRQGLLPADVSADVRLNVFDERLAQSGILRRDSAPDMLFVFTLCRTGELSKPG